MIVPTLIILVLVLINALYGAAELSTVAVRRTRIEQLATEGNIFARLLKPIINDRQRVDTYIAACQIGITASSLVLGAYGNRVISGRLAEYLKGPSGWNEAASESLAVIVTLLGLTAFQVVVAELVPKSIAMRYPTRVALFTTLPVRWSMGAFKLFLWLLNGSANSLLRLLRISSEPYRSIHVAEEIDLLMEDSHEGGVLDDAERERLHNVFRLATRKVREVMIPRTKVFAVDTSTPIEDLLNVAVTSPYTRIPVYQGDLDHVIGAVHIKDLLASTASNTADFSLGPVLREIPRVLESMPISQLLTDMRAMHVHMSLVVDEYGGTSGIVTLEDLLEEVVGDIPDEYAKGVGPSIVDLPDDRFRLIGALSVEDINSRFGMHIEYPEADTLAGLLMGLLGRIPQAGDKVELDGAVFLVESVNHTVETVLFIPPGSPGQESNS